MRLGRWMERILLAGFDEAEVEDITRDLGELAADRGAVAGRIYYWVELLKYPARNAWDALRHDRTSRLRRERERGSGMESLWKDTRYAVRALARTPGFSVMAVTIIAVGMGAATAIFSVVDGVLLEPLPVEEPERLVSVWLEDGRGRSRMTPGNFVDISEVEGVFSHVAAFQGQTTSLSLDGEPVFLRGSAVTSAYFEALGVRPAVGRTFREDEGEVGGPAVVILSHHIWQQMFAADPAITTRTVNLDGGDFQVVGVLPPGVYPTHATVSAEIPFTASNQDFFVPLRYSTAAWANRRSHLLGMIGRLAPSVAPETARAGLASLSARLQASEPLNRNEHILMTSFTEEVVGDVRFALFTLLATVGLVLFIAIVNVGALFVLRADDRRPTLAIRAALGAPRGRLLRQLFLESTLIAAAASLAAVGVGRVALQLMRGLVPYQIPRLADVGIDGGALVVTMVAGGAIAAALGVAPALRLHGERWAQGVGRTRHTPGLQQRRAQAGVVAVQAGLCVVVLVGAALLSRSYAALRAVDTGFEEGDTWAMSIPAQLSTMEEITLGVRELAGVAAAAIAYDHPLSRSWGDGFVIEGVERSDTDPPWSASLRPFGEGYFRTVGIDVVEGRVPDAVDLAGDVGYAVINQSLAETFFAGRAAIGARIILPTAQRMFGTDGVFEILGVVRDVRFLGPDQPASPALYVPLTHFRTNASTLLVRSDRADAPVLAGVRQVVAAIDSGLGVQRAQRMSDVLDGLLARPRFNMMLLVTFAMIGLVLCGLGAYGLVGRVVAMRVREIGIQMALGADRARLARAVMASAIRPMLVGAVVGVAGAVVLARFIRSLLFGVSPADPVSLVASPGFVLLVGVVAALAPTLQAVSIDPASSLRSE
jgi:putative ABC transport system permease protein